MVHLSRKTIKGRPYLYAVHSFRLPDGKIAKVSRAVKSASEAASPALKEFFEERQAQAAADYARRHFKPLGVRDRNALEKLERMRLEYKRIVAGLSPAQLRDLFDRFTVNFTYESNALEGNSLTLKDVAIVIHENAAIKGKDLREVYDARNSREVVDLILKKKFRVTEGDALKMHSLLVRDMGIGAGYKTVPNFLFARSVATTAPEKVASEMRQLFKWFGENKAKTHPLQLAARFHGMFEEIHPFEDGNGRVGRFIINVLLVNAGYPPLIVRKTQRLSYFNALEAFDKGNKRVLEEFLYARLKETHEKFFKVYAKYVK